MDILQAIERIEKYVARGRAAVDEDEALQDAIARRLQILGEAANSLSAQFQTEHADWPWPGMTGIRNILVHEYFRINWGVIWSVIENDLPGLKKQVLRSLEMPKKRPARPEKKRTRKSDRKRKKKE